MAATETGTIVVETAVEAATGTDMVEAEDMAATTDVSAIDPPVLLGTMMTIRDVLPTMKMTDAQVSAVATMTVAVSAEEEGAVMTGATAVSAAVAADVTAVAEGTRMASALPREDLRLRKAPFPCRRGGGRPLDGMFLPPVMSSIQPCRLSKQVYCSLFVFRLS